MNTTAEPAKEITWSPFSRDIFNAVENTNENIVVGALAGSGKTTNAVECANIIDANHLGSYMFYAFNNKIVDALKPRLRNPAFVRTVNSLGLNMLFVALGFYPQLNDKKYLKLIQAFLPVESIPTEKFAEAVNLTKDILFKSMAELVYPNVDSFYNDCERVIEYYGLDIPFGMTRYDVMNVVKKCLVTGEKMLKVKPPKGFKVPVDPNGGMEFIDQIYFPNYWNLKCPVSSPNSRAVLATDFVIGDEIQDWSKAQLGLIKRAIKPGGRFIGFGDRNQAIYAFAGADTNSVDNIVSQMSAKVLPLSICYRCPKAVIRAAQKIVPEIQAWENAIEGEENFILDTELPEILRRTPGAVVLSRKTNPLVKMCIKLIRARIPAVVKGRDIGAQLLKLAKELVGSKKHFGNLENDIFEYMENQLELMKEWKDRDSRLDGLNDRIEAVRAIVEAYEVKNIQGFANALETLFSDSDSVITLMTVHKAKGLEFEQVFIIDPEHMPNYYPNQKEWEEIQEMNLKYVAITRAMFALTWVQTTVKEAA